MRRQEKILGKYGTRHIVEKNYYFDSLKRKTAIAALAATIYDASANERGGWVVCVSLALSQPIHQMQHKLNVAICPPNDRCP
jgi:hypothetical protein